MATTCFFCQNLLSDFIEGILPASRYEELKGHLEKCQPCARVKRDLTLTLENLKAIPPEELPEGLLLRMTEAAEAGREPLFSRAQALRVAPWVMGPLVFLVIISLVFPTAFPWLSYLRYAEEDTQFERFFPLLQGARDIIDEQAGWLTLKDPLSGSLWEEGGMTPDEFEKTFEKKGVMSP